MGIKVIPTRRDLTFKLNAKRALSWHPDGLNVAQFLNSMSLFFPVGERFFIDSVRNYRNIVTDPNLKKAVTAFIGQEAMHSREHIEYNNAIATHGVPVDAQEKFVAELLSAVQKYTPKSFQLAATVALEHLTAILAAGLLDLDNLMEGADADYKTLWQWHALEETEHKAVAFDVYQLAMGGDDKAYSYLLRSTALVLATSIFFAIFIPYYLHNVRIKGGLFDFKGWSAVARLTWGKKGIFTRITPDWFDWFKPGFHPWDHDNSAYLKEISERLSYVLDPAYAA